jgi:hypothetical protein
MTKKSQRWSSRRSSRRQKVWKIALVFFILIILAVAGYYILQNIGVIGGNSNPAGAETGGTLNPDDLSVGLPPAWTPTPSSDIEPDFSQWGLQLSDLPLDFENEPIDETGALPFVVAGIDNITKVKTFAFSKESEPPQFVSGMTLLIPDQSHQTAFDEQSSDSEFILEGIIATLEPLNILEQNEIPDMEEIGDFSFGQSYLLDMEAVEMRVDFVAFRRDVAGALLFSLYVDEYPSEFSIQDLAKILDQRILSTFLNSPQN